MGDSRISLFEENTVGLIFITSLTYRGYGCEM